MGSPNAGFNARAVLPCVGIDALDEPRGDAGAGPFVPTGGCAGAGGGVWRLVRPGGCSDLPVAGRGDDVLAAGVGGGISGGVFGGFRCAAVAARPGLLPVSGRGAGFAGAAGAGFLSAAAAGKGGADWDAENLALLTDGLTGDLPVAVDGADLPGLPAGIGGGFSGLAEDLAEDAVVGGFAVSRGVVLS